MYCVLENAATFKIYLALSLIHWMSYESQEMMIFLFGNTHYLKRFLSILCFRQAILVSAPIHYKLY